MKQQIKNVVLVHGAFADGSGWKRVADILKKDGYKVSVAQPGITAPIPINIWERSMGFMRPFSCIWPRRMSSSPKLRKR